MNAARITVADRRSWFGVGFFARMSGSTRLWMFSLLLAAIAVAGAYTVVEFGPPAMLALTIPGWLLVGAFFLTEAKVIHLHIGRSAHSFSLSELPLVAGLFLVAPPVFIAARLIGSTLGLFFGRRQRGVKLTFNLALFSLCSVVSVWIVHLAAPADSAFGPAHGVAILLVAVAENLIGVVCVSTAISLAEGAPQYRRIPEMLKIGLMVSLTNSSLALMGLAVLVASPQSVWLFVVPTIMAALAYRAYVSERNQHESIELLFESTRILQRSPQLETAITMLLEHARKMFRADVAEINLLPRKTGDDIHRSRVGPGAKVEVMLPVGPSLEDPILIAAITERQARLIKPTAVSAPSGAAPPKGGTALVAPLLGESNLMGTIMVSIPISDVSTFELDDLKLFETLANHIAIALENGQLEKSLEQLGRLKEELHHQASHDSLTGLANRSLFSQHVSARLEARDSNGQLPVVLFIDLDDFKLVNDSLGHAAGDTLLVAVGERLHAALREDDVAARLGGDEFAVLLRDTPDLRTALGVANRLSEAMNPSFQLEGRDVTVRASIGIAAGRPGVDTAGELLRNADVAMYSAKARGKARVAVFESSMHDAVMTRAQISADLERAIAVREFVLLYQPIVEISTGRITGVEALVRWEHPTRGRVGPDDFIRVAEQSDLILQIGRWALGQACQQVRQWQEFIGDRPFTISVNIAARQLMQPDFVQEVLDIVRASGADPERVVLEMTETSMLHDSDATRSKLLELREAGIGVAIDDFGTGYSSLSYLQRFPVTSLKIAQDFVVQDCVEPEAWELAGAIISLGNTLKLLVIAEGVEKVEQLDRLRSLGCNYVQGFYIAKPLEARSVQSLLTHGVTLTGAPAAETAVPAAAVEHARASANAA